MPGIPNSPEEATGRSRQCRRPSRPAPSRNALAVEVEAATNATNVSDTRASWLCALQSRSNVQPGCRGGRVPAHLGRNRGLFCFLRLTWGCFCKHARRTSDRYTTVCSGTCCECGGIQVDTLTFLRTRVHTRSLGISGRNYILSEQDVSLQPSAYRIAFPGGYRVSGRPLRSYFRL